MFTTHENNNFTYLTAPNIGTTHAFSARYGEESNGRFPDSAMEALCSTLKISPGNIIYNKQVHGNVVRVITPSALNSQLSAFNFENEADALITDMNDIALMVFTADCVPVLLHDINKNVIGAVHAGWRGTASGIVINTIKQMDNCFGSSSADIHAAIGPCISGCCFETGADVADAMRDTLQMYINECIRPHSNNKNKYMIDLKEANRLMLISAGIKDCNISVSDECTVCTDNGEKYWSHRRQGQNRAAQAAVIVSNQ